MSLKKIVAALLLGGMQAVVISEAAQLPGTAILFNQNQHVESKTLRGYNTPARFTSATTTAALVRNLGNPLLLPSCRYWTGETVNPTNFMAWARGVFLFRVYETKANSTPGRRIFSSCSTAPSFWPPTGDQLFIASYPGPILATTKCFSCFETLLLLSKHPSLETTALEWTVW